MKKCLFFCLVMLACCNMSAQVSKIVGDWYTVDDRTGESYSIIHIFKATNGKYYGKIQKMLVSDGIDKCVKCKDADKDKPYEGLIIIRDMVDKDGELVGGNVLDPETGKFYYGKIYLKNGNLVLRGSLDRAGILGRSQTWVKSVNSHK